MKLLCYVLLALCLWYVSFVLMPPGLFWVSIIISVLILSAISFYHYRDQLSKKYFTFVEIGIGIVSAVVLYGIFRIGNVVLASAELIPGYEQYISSMYQIKEGLPGWIIIILLVPVAIGEEIFWRGYIQRCLAEKYSKLRALLMTVFFYTFIHLPIMNPLLILAAIIAGLSWGLLFMWRKNIVAAIISHVVFDILIFVLFPLE